MAEFLYLKSKLLHAADPWEVDISQFQVPLTVNQKLYERDLLNFLRRFATVEETAEVAARDMVTLTCDSENPRFCKEHITIRIGMGLFSKELENALIGWKKDQMGTVNVKGQSVCVTVESIRREILPEVDDALAARCGVPGIQTAKDIHTYCKGNQFRDALEGPADEAFTHLCRTIMENSEFELDPEEVKISQDRMVQELNKNSLFRDTGIDGMPEERFYELFGCSKAELVENMRASGALTLKSALLGQAMLERAGKLLTAADYESYLRRYLDAADKTGEQVRQEKTEFSYLLDTYGDYFMNEMEEFAFRRLAENIV